MSISSIDRADTRLSNRIDVVPVSPGHTTPRDSDQAIEHNGITQNTISRPQKRAVAASFANAMYSPGSNGIHPFTITGDRSGALSESSLTVQLFTADTQIRHLLQRQPDFHTVTAATFRSALNAAFPALVLPIDLDGIYVTTYVNEIVEITGGRRGSATPANFVNDTPAGAAERHQQRSRAAIQRATDRFLPCRRQRRQQPCRGRCGYGYGVRRPGLFRHSATRRRQQPRDLSKEIQGFLAPARCHQRLPSDTSGTVGIGLPAATAG